MSLPKFSAQFRRIAAVLLMLLAINPLFAQNRIVTENLIAGTPQSAWDATDGGTIEGFAEEFSVEPGQTVHFKIDIASGSPQPFTVKIYRLGWYQGNGARFVADLGNSLTGGLQTTTTYDAATGRTECSNWPRSAAWGVPSDAVPGVYIARMDCPNVGGSAILIFVVTDPVTSLNSDLLFKTSDATWQAYNPYGGNNFYVAGIPVPGYSHATKISYQRPLHLRGDKSNFFNAEYPMIRWLERNGYDVSYTTDQAISRDNTPLTPSKCRVFLSVGHDEYWSAEARNKIESARNSGVHLAFFSGNEVYWKTRWEDNFETLVCYKEGDLGESTCGTKCDPLPNVWTGLWRDGCQPSYAANDGCKPEGSLTGQMSWTQSIGSIKVPDTYKNLRFWKNTAVETLPPGGTLTLPYGTLGNEWDPEQLTETYPPHRTVLSNTYQTNHTHKMSLFRHANGALVFGAGTMQWAWGLDANHDLNAASPPAQPESRDMQQATLNLLFDMGVTPGTIQGDDLVLPAALNDVTPPTSVITSPFHGSNVAGGSVTVTGNSVDDGGGALGGVEVSVDGGLTWNVADGLEDWSYTFSPSGYGTINIQVRAWDEFGNVETVGSLPSANSIAVSLTGPFNYSVFNATYPQQVPIFFTGGPVELGMKFRSSIPGYITGLKYYKGADVTGVHIGHLWDNNGNLLATETFVDETAFGWQTVPLSNPVLIQPNTTYVVSYFTSSGDFERTVSFFNQSIQNGYLTGLADGVDGGNGVYVYNNSPAFPTESSASSNYWADVIMTPSDITAPTVISTNPLDAATGVNLNVAITINFDEDLDASTVNSSTVILTGAGNAVVPATINVSGSVITITPNSPLDIVTTYTVTVKGGITPPQIKDISGNALAADYVFSFTTGGLTAPDITGNPSSTSTCANAPISFVSSGTGIPTPTIQWQVSTDGGLNWSNISGANSATYTFTAQSSDDGKQYRSIYTNSEGADTTTAATLTVAATITASIQAVNSNICPGDPLQLQLTSATGIAPFTLTINSQVYNNISVGEIITPVLASENIFGPADIPAEQIHSDNNAVELGVKFKSSVNGIIKGIRFHKGGPINGGVHIGNLWTTTGTLLATATFTNETNSGWQEVLFSSPVSVTANTVYVASCFMPQGNYSKSGGYFDGVDHTNGQSLTAPQSAPGEANGVYEYAGTSTYPANDAFSTNYWVDVVFAPFVSTTTTFNLTSINAANGCSLTGNPISSATINVSASVTAGVVSGLSPLCINATATYNKTGDIGGTWSSSNPAVATVNPTTGLVTAVGAGSTNIIYTVNGCSGPATASQSLVVSPDANAGIISGSAVLCIGTSEVYTTNGDAGGAWSSSNTAVATVNATTGEVTAIATGTANILYTLSVGCNSPVSSSISLNVGGAGNAGTVSGSSPVCIGATATFTSNGDAGGTWSSSNTAVATVNPATGEVTALSAGSTNIIYTVISTCGSPVTAQLSLTVSANVNAGTVSGSSPLCIAATATFTSNGDAGGTWSSSNAAVATVNPTTGEVTAVFAGTSDIIYTIASGCGSPVSSQATVTVSANVSAGTVSGSSPLCIGATATFTSNGDAGGSWSSSNAAVATVNPTTGEVTAVSAGTSDIIYTIASGCGSPVSSQATVTVNANVNAGTVSGSSPLCIAATATFTSNGDAGGSWSSSNTAVATVNPTTGEVIAVSAGTSDIIYTLASGCGSPVSSQATVTVNSNVNAGTVSGSSPLCIGANATFTSNGDAGGSWSSSNTSVATVNPTTGEVTAISAGTSDIIYTIASGCGSPVLSQAAVTVSANVSAGTVSGSSPLCIAATATFTSNGDAGGSWSSSNTAVATVNPTTGELTAIAAGTSDIIYTIASGCGSPVSSQATVTVNSNVNAGTVSGSSPLCIGANATFTSNGDAGGSWSSSNTSVATVNPTTGEVTAISAGTSDIIYTIASGCGSPVLSQAAVTVSANVSAGTVSGSSPLCIGANATFTSNGDAGGSWSSSNTSVATVNPTTGEVTAVSAGTSDIIYTIASGCGSPVSSQSTVAVSANVSAGTVSGSSPLCIGSLATFSSNGTAGGSWSSSNTAVATVNPTTGEVTAVSAGTSDIIYTISSGCGSPVSSQATITVTAASNAGTITGSSPLCVASTTTFTSNGDAGGVWSSSSPLVASVNPATGEVLALIPGNTTISYTVTGSCGSPVVATFDVTVNVVANAGTISGTTTVCVGATQVLTSNGDAGGTWSSSNPAVASVNAATGEVKALTAGTTDINYTVNACLGPQSATFNLTVNALTGTLAGVPGDGQSCKTLTIGATGTTFTDASCNLIATVMPSGLSPVNGSVNTCVTIDQSVQVFQGNPYVQRHYDIEPSNDPTGATATVTLYFTQADFDAYNLERGIQPALPNGPFDATGKSHLLVTQYHGIGTAPGNYSGDAVLINPVDANIVWNGSTGLWEVSFDVVGFSGFYVYTSIANTPLPITLISFNGKNNGAINVLNWSTSSEQNSDHFEVERSIDGANFIKVANVAAAGNSSSVRNYHTDDNISGVSSNIFYYRLKMVDINGTVKYSSIVTIRTNGKGVFITAVPNPFVEQMNLQIISNKQDKAMVSICDVSGRSLSQKQVNLAEGSNVVRMNEFTNMAAGVYILRVQTNSGIQSLRVVKQ